MRAAEPPRTTLKQDIFGRIEFWDGPSPSVLRVATGARLPGSGVLARILLRREVRALQILDGLDGVPRLIAGDERSDCGRYRALRRSFLAGLPLHQATALPRDFFDHLRHLVTTIHAQRICHNDLHKEQNILVRPDGRPAVIDFQLASVHRASGPLFRSRCRDDLRHIEKHRLRYQRRGRAKRPEERSSRALPRRSLFAGVWRRTVKPVYNLVTRRLLRWQDGELRRRSAGPWPDWVAPLGDWTGRGGVGGRG